jgi:hypothetical protein
MYVALFALGGLPALVWGGALRTVWVYHITWLVNSATHCWGYQSFNTGEPLAPSLWPLSLCSVVVSPPCIISASLLELLLLCFGPAVVLAGTR